MVNGSLSVLSWISDNAHIIIAFLVSGGLIIAFLDKLKKWHGNLKGIKLVALHYALAILPMGIHYIQGLHTLNPGIVLLQAFIMLGANSFIYEGIVKPSKEILSDAKAKSNIDKAVAEGKALVAEFQG